MALRAVGDGKMANIFGEDGKYFLFQCSATCGQGKVHRKVTCLGTCDDQTKPHTTEDCHVSTPCSQEWLVSSVSYRVINNDGYCLG